MNKRPPILLGVMVLVVALAALVGAQVVFAQLNQTPVQPVGFTHATHAGQLEISCLFCHRNADKGANASVPAVQQCMFCHSVVTGETMDKQTEIAKVRAAFQDGQPIDWLRVHRMPDHVRFVHEAHVRGLNARYSGITIQQLCSTCHGDVPNTVQVSQVVRLKMGDCVACHRATNAPTDCITCHK